MGSQMSWGRYVSRHLRRAFVSLTPSTPPFRLFLGFFNSLEFLSPPRLEALKTLIIECPEELSPNAVLKVYLLTVARAIIRGTGSSAPCTPTLGAGWALGPAWHTLRALSQHRGCVCGGRGCGSVSYAPQPHGPVSASCCVVTISHHLENKSVWLSRAQSAVGYRSLKDGCLAFLP